MITIAYLPIVSTWLPANLWKSLLIMGPVDIILSLRLLMEVKKRCILTELTMPSLDSLHFNM